MAKTDGGVIGGFVGVTVAVILTGGLIIPFLAAAAIIDAVTDDVCTCKAD